MGTIDETIHSLTCLNCNIVEEQRVLDKGSIWSGSHWQSGVEFQNFNISWSGGDKVEPSIVKAKCKRCGKTVQHKRH